MQLFEALGLEPKILIAQIINFVILIFLLKRFLYTPVVNLLEERKQKIAEGLENAEKAKVNLEKADADVQDILDKAYAESKQILVEAKAQAEATAKEIVAKANEQADKTLAIAKREANEAKDKALAEARGHIGNIVVMALEKIVGGELDASQREKVTAKTINDLYK